MLSSAAALCTACLLWQLLLGSQRLLGASAGPAQLEQSNTAVPAGVRAAAARALQAPSPSADCCAEGAACPLQPLLNQGSATVTPNIAAASLKLGGCPARFLFFSRYGNFNNALKQLVQASQHLGVRGERGPCGLCQAGLTALPFGMAPSRQEPSLPMLSLRKVVLLLVAGGAAGRGHPPHRAAH